MVKIALMAAAPAALMTLAPASAAEQIVGSSWSAPTLAMLAPASLTNEPALFGPAGSASEGGAYYRRSWLSADAGKLVISQESDSLATEGEDIQSIAELPLTNFATLMPEPLTWAMIGTGFVVIGWAMRGRQAEVSFI
jgi:hypothetical protein